MSRKSTSVSYDRPHRPLALRIANRLGRLGRRLGLQGVDLSEESLISTARRRTGLSDLGDTSFRTPMRVLLDATEREARLHPCGRIMARHNLVRVLSNRLRIEDEIRRRPEILDTDLQDPVVITGLQRTATTLLHRLMAKDPAFRVLASWEAVNPAPWPGTREGKRDPRIRAAWLAEKSVSWLAPDFFAIHPVEAESPEEDVLLLEFAFLSTVPEAMQRVPTYSRWLEQEADHVEGYRYLGKMLRLLSSQRPGGRWLLKSPHHLEHLDALVEVFPGARIIQAHRDPVVSLASFCSMIAHARGIFTDDVDPYEVGRHWSVKRARMVERAMGVRERLGEDRFLDVMYDDLVADPVGQIRRVYGFLDVKLGRGSTERMRAHLWDNPRDRRGRHTYDLSHFGLDADTEEQRFARYRARYRIPREERPL